MQTSPQQPEGIDGQEPASVRRSVDIDASVEQVWDALATPAGRERWIDSDSDSDPDRVLIVDAQAPPTRISWWWWSGEEPATHVDLRLIAIPTGARVIVTETGPAAFPVARLAASFHLALAFA